MRELVHSTQNYATERFKGSENWGSLKKQGFGGARFLVGQSNAQNMEKRKTRKGLNDTFLKPIRTRIGSFYSELRDGAI